MKHPQYNQWILNIYADKAKKHEIDKYVKRLMKEYYATPNRTRVPIAIQQETEK